MEQAKKYFDRNKVSPIDYANAFNEIISPLYSNIPENILRAIILGKFVNINEKLDNGMTVKDLICHCDLLNSLSLGDVRLSRNFPKNVTYIAKSGSE